MRKGDTIKITKEGALRPGMTGLVLDVNRDGRVKAEFEEGTFKVDAGEYVHVPAAVGLTVEIVKKGALPVGARGVIRGVDEEGNIEAAFADGDYKVDAGEFRIT